MAGLTKTQVTYTCTTTAPRYVGVVLDTSGEGKVKVPDSANGIPVGVIANDEQLVAGRPISVQIDGYVDILAGEDIAIGDEVILGVGGKVVKASTIASGTANILGVAETAGVLNGKVTVRIEKKAKEVIPVVPEIPVLPVYPTGIAIKTPPTKTTYTTSDTLDLAGLVVTLTLSDNTTLDVEPDRFAIRGIATHPANGASLATPVASVQIACVVGAGTVGIAQDITVS